MKTYQTYLFDLDGTLITTIDLICACFAFSLKKYLGREFPREDILLHIGLPLQKQFTYFIQTAGGEPEKFDLVKMTKDHMDYQLQIWRDYVHLYPHALEVVSTLKESRKQVGIVTSRLFATAELYLEHTGLLPHLDCIITPDSTRQHKPHPEPVWEALRKVHGEADPSVMIGDSLFDIECGHAAGVDTVWMVHPDSPWMMALPKKKLSEQEPARLATSVITDLRAILPATLSHE